MQKKIFKLTAWIFIAILGASAFGGIAVIRGEKISSLWFLTACICTQLIAYRFYSAWIATKISMLTDAAPLLQPVLMTEKILFQPIAG